MALHLKLALPHLISGALLHVLHIAREVVPHDEGVRLQGELNGARVQALTAHREEVKEQHEERLLEGEKRSTEELEAIVCCCC